MMRSMQRRLFAVMWAFWAVCAVASWGVWLISVPRFLQRAALGTLPTVTTNDPSPAIAASEGAAAWGVSVTTWSWINVIVNSLSFLVFCLVAFLIWRRVRTGFGLLTAYILILGGSAFMSVVVYSAELPAKFMAVYELGAIIWPLFFPWLYLFPNGKAVPRRFLWVLGPLMGLFAMLHLLYMASIYVEASTPFARAVEGLQPVSDTMVPAMFALIVCAQIYRYIKVSGAVEREQTKWFLLGLVITFAVPALLSLIGNYPDELNALTFMALPIGIGVAILRYRLWDIDIIIRRTLQYALLTGLLASVYFGCVLLLQQLFEALTGQTSPVAIVASTLAIAALFNPLRYRVQAFIDRRLFRRKYDAAQTLTAFAAAARDETDLDALTAQLMRVVAETMQPEKVRLWLNEPPDIVHRRGAAGE
jgi:uncharacterized membrane protein